MKTLLMLVMALLCGSITAQDAAEEIPENPSEQPTKESAEETTEEEEEETQQIPADFAKYILKKYPKLDLKDEHDIFNLKDYSNVDKRHSYVESMTQIMQMYYSVLDMGSTYAKVFDQYYRGKHGTQASFRCLYAATMLYYPPGKGNIAKAETMLRELGAEVKDFAFPWFFLAQLNYERLSRGAATIEEVQELVDKALKIRPNFKRATLLSARLKLFSSPPKLTQCTKLIEPLLTDKSVDSDLLEDAFTVYVVSAGFEDAEAKATELCKGSELSVLDKTRINLVLGSQYIKRQQPDEAVNWLEKALKLIVPENDAETAMSAYEAMAVAWSMQATLLKQEDPNLEGGNSKLFEDYVKAASENHKLSASIETKHLPVAFHGIQALKYAFFLRTAMEDHEQALEWLEKYLAETDLTVRRREGLESVVRNIKNKLNPTEVGFLEQIDEFVKAKDDKNLKAVLVTSGVEVRNGAMHFKTRRALKTFVSLLDHKDRVVVGLTATLLEDTARTIGDDAIGSAGDALAKRLEQETECVSDEQSRLQVQLHGSIRRSGHWPTWIRAMKHAKLMIDSIEGRRITAPLKNVNSIWFSDEALGAVPTAPEKPGRLDQRNKEFMREFWDAFIKATEAAIAANEKPPEDDTKEPSDD
ncbi:MAG: hypothetical protein ACYTDT_06210 [Planctomycetota bacterium]|jgi:tetratricopeptide (TPR) repeat protein